MQRSTRTLAVVGIVTWLAAASPLLALFATRPELLRQGRTLGWLVALVLFGAGFIPAMRGRVAPGTDLACAALQSATAIAAVCLYPFSASNLPANAVLFVVAAARFPLAGWPRTGLLVIILQTAVLFAVYEPHLPGWRILAAFVGTFAGFQLFAHAVAAMAHREERTRTDLAHTLDELRSTRGLVAAGSRLTERMRIARELHDSLGHNLTALSLNLELARHQDARDARDSVETARSLCRLLLAQLRDVLDDVRATDGADLKAAIKEIIGFVPRPSIELAAEDDLGQIDPEIAHELLRCVQEIVTNTLRHADAEHLYLELGRRSDSLVVRGRDDGRGLPGERQGTGLRGMAERVAGIGGRLDVRTGPGGNGVEVELAVPTRRDRDVA